MRATKAFPGIDEGLTTRASRNIRRRFGATIACILATGALVACSAQSSASAGSGKTQTIKLSMANSNTSSEYKMAQKFAAALAKDSGNRLKIQIYPASQLGPVGSEIESVRSGTIQAIAMSGLDSVIPETDAAYLPYMFTSMNEAQKALNGNQMQQVLWSKFSKYDMKVVGTWPVGPFGIMSRKAGVDNLDALKGQRIRVVSPLVSGPLLKAWGANPTPVDSSQVLTALSTGLVDGVLNPPDPITSQGWQQYGKSYLETDSIYNFNPVVFSQKFLNGLSPDLRGDIQKAFTDTLPDANSIYGQDEAQSLSTMKSAGIHVYTPSSAELSELRQASTAAESQWEKSFGADLVKKVRQAAKSSTN